ncbi:hypothetical protein [Bradyrhizobium sp. Gha]|uniref:hypothetical protein n=1 Tax=Bradyrhizobium sp. Gha TaxID=1855318 RepID=UPI0011600B71|nr:hypothetical protein [Bradyrhizobium sp. Gha]
MDEAETDRFAVRHHRHRADVNDAQVAAFDLTPDCRARSAGLRNPFVDAPTETAMINRVALFLGATLFFATRDLLAGSSSHF